MSCIAEEISTNYGKYWKRGENISYLVPRDPSITCWSDRVKLPAPCTNLIQLDEFEETMGDKIKVYLRLKPTVSTENPYTVLNSTTLQTEAPKDSVSYKNVTNGVGKLIHKFTFTSILDENTTQAELFKKCAVKSLKKFLLGENYLLMAYGTTSAGKTYTMQGNVENPGVIPRALDFLFTSLKDNIIPMCRYTPHQYNEFLVPTEEQLKKDLLHKAFILSLDLTKYQKYPDTTQMSFQTNSSSGFSDSYENVTFKEMKSNLVEKESFEMIEDMHLYSVWISMIEIYNEQVYDLLDVPSDRGLKPKLTFRDDECGNTFVKNLRYVNVSSGHEAFQILQFGRSNLHLAPTALNARSSRSHCIFTITLAKFLDYETSSHAVISRFSFCDLAGMERAKKTLNVKDRLVESKAINTSLSILVKCLTAIKENQNSKEKKMIPYRESKLTKLFRDAIMGKEQFSLIVNVTTEPNLFDETLNVLKFSAIAQKIVPQNVFVKPRVAKAVKRSRFSRIVVNSSYNSKIIDWEASAAAETKVKEETVASEEGADELRDLVEVLREQLAQEKKRCEKIEAEIREELTSKFWEMLKKQNENNQMRLESETERLHEMFERKERRLVHYYEILRKNKRPRSDDDESEYEDKENRLKELENEGETLRREVETLKDQLQELRGEKNKLASDCAELKFKLVEKDRALNAMDRTNKANEAGSDALGVELRKQLDEANAKISQFKSLLDEAAADYKQVEGQNKYLRNENEVLEVRLAEHSETVADLRSENAELHKMLSQKRILVEKLEAANEKFLAESNAGGRETEDGWKMKIEEMREELRRTREELERCRETCEELQAEKLNLETDLEIGNCKIADLQSKLLAVKENEERETERLAATTKEKEIMEERCRELEAEVKTLQKEVKDLIGASEKASERAEVEALTKENEAFQKEILALKKRNQILEEEVKQLREEMRNAERESKIALESLRAKFEAVEYQNSVMKNLKDEAERQAHEVPELHEEIKRLEKEIENREKDMTSFNENRKALFANYEKEVTRLKEENERLRKDVLFANEVIAKNMTPLKTDKAEISRLKESVKKKDEEINKLKAEMEGFKMPETESSKKRDVGSTKKHESGCVKNLDSESKREGNSAWKPETPLVHLNLEESSSRENSPFVNLSKRNEDEENKKVENNFEKLTRQVENLTIQQPPKSMRKKVDLLEETIHPSAIKNTTKGRKKKENGKKEKETEKAIENEKENIPSKKKGKCYKKLFTDNDFDELVDLSASPLEEISRLRPRK